MLSHVFVGISDFERALAFYRPVLSVLGVKERFCEPRPALEQVGNQLTPAAVCDCPPLQWRGAATPATAPWWPLQPPRATRWMLRTPLALSLGAVCEGRPGLRPEYPRPLLRRVFSGTGGNKLCVACHAAPL